VDDDIRRIVEIWEQRQAQAADGPFLFGTFAIADAVWKSDAMRERLTTAEAEPWVIEEPKI
jgi:hypothetical protein